MPQIGPDLVSAGYPISRPLTALLGGATNAYQTNVPVKSNLDWTLGSVVDGTAPGTGVCLSTPVPALPGDVFTKATYIMGATAASPFTTGSQFNLGIAAVYAGTGSRPALVGQSSGLLTTTGSSLGIAGSTQYSVVAGSMASLTFTFGTPIQITSTNAPYGFVYADVSLSLSTLPTLVSQTVTASVWSFPWFANGPQFMAATHDTNAGSLAPNPQGAQSYVAKAPVVFLY